MEHLNIRTIKAVIFLTFGLGANCTAEVTWVAPSHPDAITAIRSGNAEERVCRTPVGADFYIGTASSSICVVNINGTSMKRADFELAIGPAEWSAVPVPNSAPAEAGSIHRIAAQICRGRVGSSWHVGWSVNSQGCAVSANSNAVTLTQMERLYPIAPTADLFLTTNRGLCGAANLFQQFRMMNNQCSQQPFQVLRLEPAGVHEYQLRFPQLDRCIISDGLSRTDARIVNTGPCGSTARLRVIYASDSSFRLQFTRNGAWLNSTGLTPLTTAFFSETAAAGRPEQVFRLRTVQDASRRLTVNSYNVMLLSSVPFPGLRHRVRAESIVQATLADRPDTDVFAFSEAFDIGGFDELKNSLEAAGFLHRSGRPVGLRENGGVFIASRWPIEEADSGVYAACWDEDCLAAKGVSYARINKMGKRYNVFVTHLQAGDSDYDRLARNHQVSELANFIQRKVGPRASEPVIIAGDLNIDMEGAVSDYQNMMTRLNAAFVNAPRPAGVPTGPVAYRWTADPAVNTIEKDRGATKAKWLDYVLTSKSGQAPLTASYKVTNYLHPTSYKINTNGGLTTDMPGAFWTRDLSDHASVLADLVFPY